MPTLLLASTNRGKLREIRALLAGVQVNLVTPDQIGLDLHVEETGENYAENARLKAEAYTRAAGLLTLADDSGLEVDALDGAPGLYSARFAPQPQPTDADRRAYLLQCLSTIPRPWTARFRCLVALALPPDAERKIFDVRLTEGICPGEIIPQERGDNGFGYDPIFLLPEIGCTMAELTMEVKNQLSHRARAIRASLLNLKEMLGLIR